MRVYEQEIGGDNRTDHDKNKTKEYKTRRHRVGRTRQDRGEEYNEVKDLRRKPGEKERR